MLVFVLILRSVHKPTCYLYRKATGVQAVPALKCCGGRSDRNGLTTVGRGFVGRDTALNAFTTNISLCVSRELAFGVGIVYHGCSAPNPEGLAVFPLSRY